MTSTPGKGLRFSRRYTSTRFHPYDQTDWERRTAAITNDKGQVIFEQKDVEVPKFWSMTATNVVVSKYFKSAVDHPGRETSARQLIDRVALTIGKWGLEKGYFASPGDAESFEMELTYLLLNQMLCFNSPVWFNCGIVPKPQISACQPYHARVLTAQGPMAIGDIVEKRMIGLPVYDGEGLTQVVAVKANGTKPVFKVELRDGFSVNATGDHLVCAHDVRRTARLEWRRVDQLEVGMVMRVYPHSAGTITRPGDPQEVSEAALAGWLQSDGYVGHSNPEAKKSLTIEFMTNGDQEYNWVLKHLDTVFPEAHSHTRDVETKDSSLDVRRIRLYGEHLRPFVEKYDLLKRGLDIRVPQAMFEASNDAAAAYLKSIFQAEGYATVHGENSGHVALAVISPDWVRDLQVLLTRFGIYSRVRQKKEKREDRHDMHELDVSIRSERSQFARKIGFLDERKQSKLLESLEHSGKECPDIRFSEIVSIRSVGEMDVYDIQTQTGQYLSEGVLVHNCFINSVEDNMESILTLARTEGMLFKWGSGTGTNLSSIRSSKERLSSGGWASGPVSFMRGYDAFAGVIRSGGKTRRAAKMVILNIDHPDVAEFIQCKQDEEKKAWALIDAGYDGSFGGEAYNSIFFQNSNNSVRVTDEFMRAVDEDEEWVTRAVTTGKTVDRYRARGLLRMIAESAHSCGDPGLQYDTTINDWHTVPNAGRIHATNPCGEFVHLDDTACNLASLNLRRFQRPDGDFDVESFKHAVRISITAQDILVGCASYPTKRIAENSPIFRPLGLGYANLGALLMSRGLPYDSDEGRACAGAITALMTGEAYRVSAEIAAIQGPFEKFQDNREPMLRVIRKHQAAVGDIDTRFAPTEILDEARDAWASAVRQGEECGYRNSQVTVLAPTGTIGFMMDCDTMGIEPDIALVKFKKMVGGGLLKLVNQSIPETLKTLGYTPDEVNEVTAYIEENGTIEGAPGVKAAHLPVFDCAFKPIGGSRTISYMGHIDMVAAVQPFLSGGVSKTINMLAETTVEEIEKAYMEGWRKGLKALALYRDGCKQAQPLNTSLEKKKPKEKTGPKSTESPVLHPIRRRLPDERKSITHKFSVGGHEGYLTVGMYEDGGPGEIFVTMAKEGSVVSGLMDCLATSCSISLQYGVPLKVLVNKFSHTRFEPAGFTNSKQIPIAKSVMDYIFRWLALKFLRPEEQPSEAVSAGKGAALVTDLPSSTTGSGGNGHPTRSAIEIREMEVFEAHADAPPCPECGSIMVRNGACYQCLNCGSTSGCG